LNGLKHETSEGGKTCEVCDGKMTMSKPNRLPYYITCRVTSDLWPSIASKWWFIKEIPPIIDLLKKLKNYLNKIVVIQTFLYIAIHVHGL
jgi:hypothetical protein